MILRLMASLVADDPRPTYSRLDNLDGLNQKGSK